MKKTIMTLGVLTAMSPMLNAKVAFADNIGMEAVESRIMRSMSEEMNATGKVVGVRANDVLNIRTAPTVKASIVGGMKNGSVVKIEGRASNGWYKVNYNGIKGYSSNDYISISNESSSSVNINKQGRVNVKTSLNIRKSPTTSSSIIGSLKNGTIINIVSKHNNDWYYINNNGKKGYVHKEYVSILDNGSSSNQNNSSASNANVGKIATVTASALNIRAGAGTNYSVINKVYSGNTVKIVEANSNGWYKVQLSSGSTGWCNGKYLNNFREGDLTNSGSSSNQNNSSTSNTNVGKIATVTASALNIRAGAGTNYSVVSKVYSGNTVKVVEANSNGWYKVQLSSGVTGWCDGTYLSNFREGSLSNSGSSNGSSSSSQSQSQSVQSVINIAKSKLGSPYVWGAEGPNTFDCSGLTLYAFRNGAGVTLPRVSRDQAKVGEYVSKANLMPGDLVFFDHNGGSNINHVGIYIGNNEMIHAPQSGDVVKITKINTNYYNNAYVTARRIIK